MNDIRLIDITADNWEKICCLNPGRNGREFVASNAFSIAQSVFENGWVIKHSGRRKFDWFYDVRI